MALSGLCIELQLSVALARPVLLLPGIRKQKEITQYNKDAESPKKANQTIRNDSLPSSYAPNTTNT